MYITVTRIRPLNIQKSSDKCIRPLNDAVKNIRPLNNQSMPLQKHRIRRHMHITRSCKKKTTASYTTSTLQLENTIKHVYNFKNFMIIRHEKITT